MSAFAFLDDLLGPWERARVPLAEGLTALTTEYDARFARVLVGAGSPLNRIVASVGTLYLRTDGGTSTTLYVKESGTGLSSGWVAK